MALARCQTCGSPRGLKHTYPHFHGLGDFVRIDILCGAPTCVRRALIWLTDEEERKYVHGQRLFRILNRGIEVLLA
jgi:hypothetical protein